MCYFTPCLSSLSRDKGEKMMGKYINILENIDILQLNQKHLIFEIKLEKKF